VDADDEHEWRPIFHAALHRHEDIVRAVAAMAKILAEESWRDPRFAERGRVT